MNDWEQDVRQWRLAEQELLRQSLEGQRARIHELETEAKYLRRLLNEMLAVPKVAPAMAPAAAVPAAARGDVPRRWRTS